MLLSAAGIEFNAFDGLGIIKISDGRIVECNMAVLADPEEDEVDGRLGEKVPIAVAFHWDGSVAGEFMAPGQRNLVAKARAQVVTKAGGMGRWESNILIHVKCRDFVPGHSRGTYQLSEEGVLRRCTSKYHPDATCLLQAQAEGFGNFGRCRSPQDMSVRIH